MSFNLPLMSNHLDAKGYSPMFIGGSMAAVSIAYMLSMPLTFKMMDKLSRRGVIFIGLSLITNGMMITGLDRVYDFENPGLFTCLGLIVFGIGFANITIPIMPEILEAIEEKEYESGVPYNEQALYNSCAAHFFVCQAVGETLGPLISTFLESKIDFRPTQKALMITIYMFLLTYLVCCDP